METKMLNFSDVKQKIGEHLKTAMGIENFSITFAKQEKDVWRVNIEFKEKLNDIELATSALFSIDAATGEVKEFRKGESWRF